MRDGTLLRGEVLARWQEFVGTGELLRALQARVGRMRDRVTAAFTGRPRPARGDRGARVERGAAGPRGRGAGRGADREVLAGQPGRRGPAASRPRRAGSTARPELARRLERTVRDWQARRPQPGPPGRRVPPYGRPDGAFGVNGTGLVVMIAVFASTAFIPTGAEVGIAGGTTVAVPEGARGALRRPGRPASWPTRPGRPDRAGRRPARRRGGPVRRPARRRATDPRDAEALERAAAAVEEAR